MVIVANKYKCNSNYTLVYEWYRYDILDGGKSYKNTKIEGTTGNVLTIERIIKILMKTNYRYYVKAYRNGESETHRGSDDGISTGCIITAGINRAISVFPMRQMIHFISTTVNLFQWG